MANRLIPRPLLQRTARTMLPFYQRIAKDKVYAERWSSAVVELELEEMLRLLRAAAPVKRLQPIATNGIGYFVTFPYEKGDVELVNGTTIPPGSVQFTFSTRAHRDVAKAILPLYRTLANNRPYAEALSKAIEKRDERIVGMMVRQLVKSKRLKSVVIEHPGFALEFKFPYNRFVYRNLLFRELYHG